MSLSDYQPERVEIKLKKGAFEVKALSLSDLASLIKTHIADLDSVFDIFAGQGKEGELTPDIAKNVATTLATDLPDLAAALIGHASVEEGEDLGKAIAGAKRLPAPLQMEALVTIGRLTFEEAGGVKKSLGVLTDLLGSLKKGKTETGQ